MGPLFLFLTKCLSKCLEKFLERSILNVWQCSEYLSRWLLSNLYSNCTLCDILTYQHRVYSHIHTLVILWALAYLELEAYLKPCETLTRLIQNRIRRYLAIARHIRNIVWPLHMKKPGILGVLEYSVLFHNFIPTRIQKFKTLSYLRKFTITHNTGIFKTWHILRTLSKI